MRGPAARRRTDRFPPNTRLPLAYRLAREPVDTAASDPHARDARLARVEAALFLANEPLSARKIATTAALTDTQEARRLLHRLHGLYDADATAFQVEEIAGGYQLLTRPVFRQWLLRAQRAGGDVRLSPAAHETLAIVAYRQPIPRADVESVRGVGCGELLTQLMEKGLVKIVGRQESLGRPVLYGTTKKFLQVFGLGSLKNLPGYETKREG
ncbi:MAG TPA: SMC-Scp complex subunit ScpB [Gemmataceae bacterium]|jgi:segregation and condensation protein B|nr:SMC-Scp complex subunit ScpB [Gemmataceae bacterium]